MAHKARRRPSWKKNRITEGAQFYYGETLVIFSREALISLASIDKNTAKLARKAKDMKNYRAKKR
jgi:hypothetical protein